MTVGTCTYTARWVFPVAGPPLPNGVVTVRGVTIDGVSPRGERTADVDFGNAAIIPGLVNAHTHLDLSGARGLIPPSDEEAFAQCSHHAPREDSSRPHAEREDYTPEQFTLWLRKVIAYRRGRSLEQVQNDIRAGLAECLRHGTTLVGDIAAAGASWDVLAQAPIHAVVFREIIGLTPDGLERWKEAVAWRETRPTLPDCRPGYSPHAPYSVHADVLRKSVEDSLPVAIHLAESPAEIELLAHRRGPFVEFLRELGIWDHAVLAESLEWLLRTVSHGHTSVIYAHGNYLPRDTRFPPHVSIAYCPRTHAAFGHPPHPFRDFLAHGGRVCLGTDSLASNPDLDVLAEARFLHRLHPEFPGAALLRLATLSGAEALGWSAQCGSLEAGKSADFVVVPLPEVDAEPHALLFADHPGPRRVLFRGNESSDSSSRTVRGSVDARGLVSTIPPRLV